MRILMLGNSFTSSNNLPGLLAQLTGAQVVAHTRGGARLSEQLNPHTKLGAKNRAALAGEPWKLCVLQEMSHGPVTSPKSFFASVEGLLWADPGGRRCTCALRHLGLPKRRDKAGLQGLGDSEIARPTNCRQLTARPLRKTRRFWPTWARCFSAGPTPSPFTPPTASTLRSLAPALRRKPWRPSFYNTRRTGYDPRNLQRRNFPFPKSGTGHPGRPANSGRSSGNPSTPQGRLCGYGRPI